MSGGFIGGGHILFAFDRDRSFASKNRDRRGGQRLGFTKREICRVTSHHSLKSQRVSVVPAPARCSLHFKQPTYLYITFHWPKAS